MTPLKIAIDEVSKEIQKKLDAERRAAEEKAAKERRLGKFYEQVRCLVVSSHEQLFNELPPVGEHEMEFKGQNIIVRYADQFGVREGRIHVGYYCFEDNYGGTFQDLGFAFEIKHSKERRRAYRDSEIVEGMKRFLLDMFKDEIEKVCYERLRNSQG